MGAADMLDQALADAPLVTGLDLSLTATGIATNAGQHLVTSEGREDAPLLARRRRLDRVSAEIVAASRPADVVFIEGPSFGQRQQRGTFDRAGLWWLVVHRFGLSDIDVVEVPPATLKTYATGMGSATKADIRVATLQRYGVDLRDDNECDAFILRAIGLDLAGRPLVKLPETHRRALKVLRAAAP